MDYYLFNKEQDYQRGQYENVAFDEGRLKLLRAGQPGHFLSRTLDSWEKETVWHRLLVHSTVGGNMAVVISVYATDSEAAKLMTEEQAARHMSLESRMAAMSAMEQLTVRNPQDLLLHQVKGRYLWIGMTLWGDGAQGPEVSLVQIFFPRESWNQYLPEIYQTGESEFLVRFLAVFQTLYDRLEREIRGSARLLDLQSAPPESLRILGDWLHVDNSHLWTIEHLRRYLERGAGTYENRGTAAALERKVEIFAGEKPMIQEGIWGEPAYRFRIFLSEQAVPDQKTYLALGRIIREGKPADMEADLIILRPWTVLGQHVYLGVNSYLNDYQEAVLDGQAMMGSAMFGGKDI